ncbi:polysaccharide pyruvyl transferase family protein [Flavobacterium sp. J27]|uniref:polysaccharide pyruvyl transferase family protein n=1 Tax=Flavobacterium sp. J27 TaxID=2060419 RepID=UPI0013EE6076|nr:polysaccharide pyruvyl transferase family protein [Flavobacterium sp. J27]
MNRIYVYWWSLNKRGELDNYGDILAPYIVEKLSGKKVHQVSHPMDRWFRLLIKHYVTVGSIIWAVSKNSIVWGSGIIKENQNVREAKFLAVRGPRTRKRLLELGYKVPEVFGDPALLLPKLIPNTIEKKKELGIIPHYVDYESVSSFFANDERIKVINLMTDDIEKTTREILECKTIISSSLHGLIVPQSYGIPALWVKFSNKLAGDNVKFYDYFESVGIYYPKEIALEIQECSYEKFITLIEQHKNSVLAVEDLLILRQNQLLSSCPFKKNEKRK